MSLPEAIHNLQSVLSQHGIVLEGVSMSTIDPSGLSKTLIRAVSPEITMHEATTPYLEKRVELVQIGEFSGIPILEFWK